MGSLAMMMASSLVGVGAADRPSTSCHRRSLVVAKAATQAQATGTPDHENVGGRRAVVFAAAAVALCAVDRGMASAYEEPKRGTAEAKRKYAPICVTMPTAKICHK
ncbi:photosystem II 5 kDa protein, chloroplastic-like [Musa acuminata AAA Group]|uniref:photosystem II 5 kDa protein, chloroplastic-like n=1 Tax=Musa acuminata AAA Group TaxID=214697 RepID=UPI0031DB88B1